MNPPVQAYDEHGIADPWENATDAEIEIGWMLYKLFLRVDRIIKDVERQKFQIVAVSDVITTQPPPP
jgi:hypothetical protein